MDKSLNNELQSKKVLFIAFDFYKYNVAIKEQMEAMGAEVDMYDQVRYSTTYSFLLRLHIGEWYMKRLRKAIIKQCRLKKYDYVFCLEIKQPDEFYGEIRRLQPKAKMILYYWDSLRFFDYRPYMHNFDKVCSFDIQDAKENEGIDYLPLFYLERYKELRNTSTDYKYDLMYISSYSQEKYKQVNELLSNPGVKSLKAFVYFSAFLLKYWSLILQDKDTNNLYHRALSFDELTKLAKESRCFFDFAKSYQTGLSMRTFETLGAYQKLITTNARIKEEPIYSRDNIFILGQDSISSIADFCNSPFVPHPIIDEYSLSRWIEKLFIFQNLNLQHANYR